jgi:hypothetical protein
MVASLGKEHTVERLHTRKILLPTKVLAINLTKVGDEEGVLVARVAHFVVDALNTLSKSLANQLLAGNHSIVVMVTMKARKMGYLH